MPIPRLQREHGCALLFLLWVVAVFESGEAAGSQEERMDNCQPKTCGEGPNVSYPFWIEREQPDYCGMPLFKLSCYDGYPVLPISGDNYTVHNISYDRATIELTKRVPEREASGSCSNFPSRNLTLERTPLAVTNTSNASIFFFFHCNLTQRLQLPLVGTAPLPCDSVEVGFRSYVGYSPLLPQPDQARFLEACSTIVNLPVVPLPHSSGATHPTYKQLLDFRITLNWTATGCTECRNSGGRCGTRFTGNSFDFICICRDRDHRVSCGGQEEKFKRSTIIGFAVGGAGGLAVLAVIVVICWRRFKPTKRSASLSKLIRSASSESYSMEKGVEALVSQTHIFSYKELEEATEGFADINELGDGGFGTVYKGKLRDGRVVAIKRLYENNFKREEQFLNEVAILNRLRHKNLVSLYGCTSRHSRGLLLVYEYVPNGTVADHLHGSRVEDGALRWTVRMNIAVETAGALAYLHAVEPQIIHRDIKTNNILLDENYHVKVADFGLSRLFPPDATHVSTVPQGTPGYLDPEYHQCYQLTDKSDVYSFGVVLAELISSKPAVDITRKRNEINLANMAISRIQNCQLQELVDPLLGYDSDDAVRSMIEQVAELAFRCLQAEKEMRPSMEEVLEVLKGIIGAAAGTRRDHDHLGGKVDQDRKKLTDDCASLLNGPVQYSPDTVHADWVSRTTTPNTSGQTLT